MKKGIVNYVILLLNKMDNIQPFHQDGLALLVLLLLKYHGYISCQNDKIVFVRFSDEEIVNKYFLEPISKNNKNVKFWINYYTNGICQSIPKLFNYYKEYLDSEKIIKIEKKLFGLKKITRTNEFDFIINEIEDKIVNERLNNYDDMILYSIGLAKNLIDKKSIEESNKVKLKEFIDENNIMKIIKNSELGNFLLFY